MYMTKSAKGAVHDMHFTAEGILASMCRQNFVTVQVFIWRLDTCTSETRDRGAQDNFIALAEWEKIRVYQINQIVHKKHQREFIRVCWINRNGWNLAY